MNAAVTLEIKKNDFPKLAKDFPFKVSIIVRKTANDILFEANANAPRDTGYMAGSSSVQFGKGIFGMGAAGDSVTSAIVYWPAHYAAYQEFGTRYIIPKLFATNAAAMMRPIFISAMKSLIKGNV